MQITFVLGNGFDRALDMKTGYNDFYEDYKKKPNKTEEIALLKKEIGKETEVWEDFEVGMGQFTLMVPDKQKYMDCFKDAKESLIEYLRSEYKKRKESNPDFLKSATYCLIHLSQTADENLSAENKSKFETSKDIDTIFNCISLNYTPVLEEGKNEFSLNAGGYSNAYGRQGKYEIGELLHVHGTLDNNPVFGVNDKTQIANENFREDTEIIEMMVKSEIEKKSGRNWREEAVRIIEKSDKMYVYGASLGETDEFWCKTIAKWFEKDPEKRQLALYYHSDKDGETLKRKQEEFAENIARHFNNKAYKKQIVVDSEKKMMKVKFVHMSANLEIKTLCSATLRSVPEKDLK